jgi:hypothetical protein
MISQEGNVQIGGAVLKQETQRETATTFEEFSANFTNAAPAVHVRLAKTFT